MFKLILIFLSSEKDKNFRRVLFIIFRVLQLLLQETTRASKKIPPIFDPLMVPHLSKLHSAIEPGITKITWTSLNIEMFVEVKIISKEDSLPLTLQGNTDHGLRYSSADHGPPDPPDPLTQTPLQWTASPPDPTSPRP